MREGAGLWPLTSTRSPTDGKCVQHHGERPGQPSAHAAGSPGGLSPQEPGGRRHRGAGSVLPLRPGRGTVGKPGQGVARREETKFKTLNFRKCTEA